jgi:hypothetical protein
LQTCYGLSITPDFHAATLRKSIANAKMQKGSPWLPFSSKWFSAVESLDGLDLFLDTG